ncbi:polysaccharide deacetylase family protein [Corynebacterium capitovis]|uniref:polysaccharide deacetylase family protein n=1 Tax=Corynebacterium capitovis TaxID=131081 RepID=UPI0012E9E1E2|nr:polysaccharide deacetylase family protein [Corynebacterium capitovis]
MVPTQFGMDLPGITRTVPTSPGVRTLALTFDACGGPHGSAVDWKLINVLRRHRVPATLFFNSRWVEANPTPRAELSNDPLFQIESHGATHAPMSVTGRSAYGIPGTSSPSEVIAEIAGASRWFRAGTAHYDDVAVRIIRDRGIRIAGFTTNLDYGGTASPDAVTTNLLGAPDGAIILGHMNQPRGGTAIGVDAALNRLANVQFVKLPLVTSA